MGNNAFKQMQVDVYGEVADAIMSMKRAGITPDQRLLHLQRELTDYVASIWRLPTMELKPQEEEES
jgi:GH15 family glucan-1,4-alpha-glucosidase